MNTLIRKVKKQEVKLKIVRILEQLRKSVNSWSFSSLILPQFQKTMKKLSNQPTCKNFKY